jgi:RHS repeat-associated protein
VTRTVPDLAYGFALGTANNGNVQTIVNLRDPGRTQHFAYDGLNRIVLSRTQATTGGNAWGQAFGYDPWGNLLTMTVTQGTAPSLAVTVGTTNRVTSAGFGYDAAGNMTGDGLCTYSWDVEGRQTSVGGTGCTATSYTYDGDGKRVKKSSGKLYWYGMNADALLETDLSGNNPIEYVFFGGKRLARRDASGNVSFYLSDHLGSSRVVTSAAGAILDDSDFYPFGGERVVQSSSGNTYKFTGKERDPESGNDYFPARYLANSLGRWLSPYGCRSEPTDATSASLGDAEPPSLGPFPYAATREGGSLTGGRQVI